MTSKWSRMLPAVAAFLLLFGQAAGAQVDMQQRIIAQAQSGIVPGRAKPDATAERAMTLGAVPEDFAQLKLAPGFLIGLKVLDDSDFTGSFRIDQDGNIELPILGAIHVSGKTAGEAETEIKKHLVDGKILKDPEMVLTIQEYTPTQVTLVGEVTSPGKYPLFSPHKLVDVLALAGGTTVFAGNEVEISHPGADKMASVHYSKATAAKDVDDAMVAPGDTVQVKRAGIVYVLGAVGRPGGYVMQEEGTLNVLQAITLAAGPTLAASTGKIFILRKGANGVQQTIEVPYKKISSGKLPDMVLRPTDILYVPTNAFKATFTNSEGLLAAVSSSSIYAAAVYK